jgi:hypothetical protein
MLELHFGGRWSVLHQGKRLALAAHQPVPWTMVLVSDYGMLRMELRLSEGGLFLASITYEDFTEPLVVSAGAVFTEAISNVLRAYRNTVNSLPQPVTGLPDERGAYYRQHLTLKRKQAK